MQLPEGFGSIVNYVLVEKVIFGGKLEGWEECEHHEQNGSCREDVGFSAFVGKAIQDLWGHVLWCTALSL